MHSNYVYYCYLDLDILKKNRTMKQHECKNKPVKGTGILNVLEFCCEKGLQIIRNDIKEKHNIKQ